VRRLDLNLKEFLFGKHVGITKAELKK